MIQYSIIEKILNGANVELKITSHNNVGLAEFDHWLKQFRGNCGLKSNITINMFTNQATNVETLLVRLGAVDHGQREFLVGTLRDYANRQKDPFEIEETVVENQQ